MSGIQWTEKTWNPLVGCSKASAGCKHCYAIGAAASVLRRLGAQAKSERGLATVEAYREALDLTGRKPRWSGRAVPMPHQLGKPLGWRKPRRVFVNSMSDLFHPSAGDDYIAAVFGVMAACPQHTFQVLTKHPERAAEWFRGGWRIEDESMQHAVIYAAERALGVPESAKGPWAALNSAWLRNVWPLPNVWLGTSAEDQVTADQRIPHLLECPAAVRWASYEPALESVDFSPWWWSFADDCGCSVCEQPGPQLCGVDRAGLDWIVVGGESGPGARPFDVQWARDTIRQCREAGVAVFVKQLGARPRDAGTVPAIRDRKGGDMSEWPTDLQVREFPEVAR